MRPPNLKQFQAFEHGASPFGDASCITKRFGQTQFIHSPLSANRWCAHDGRASLSFAYFLCLRLPSRSSHAHPVPGPSNSSRLLTDLAIARAARALVEVERKMRDAPPSIRSEADSIARDTMKRAAGAIRGKRYATAYDLLDNL